MYKDRKGRNDIKLGELLVAGKVTAMMHCCYFIHVTLKLVHCFFRSYSN